METEAPNRQPYREFRFLDLLLAATPRLFVTPALVGLNVSYFLLMVLFGVSVLTPEPGEILQFGANFGPLTLSGEWWRLATSTFVHIGVVHLAFNMWCLWILGGYAERMFGNWTFLIIYLLSGLGGSLASSYWHPHVISAGASGAVFGIAGALAAFLYLGHIDVPRPVVRELFTSIVVFIGFNLIFGAVMQGIDNAGHLGGLVVGVVSGAALNRPLPARPRALARYLIVPILLLVFLATARMAQVNAVDNPEMMASEAMQLYAAGRRGAAIEKLERAVAIEPEHADLQAQLGLLYLEANRFDEAVETLETTVTLAPESAEWRNELGFAYLRAGRYDQAIAAFHEAIDLDPELYEAQRNLAIGLSLAGRDEQAIEELRTARQMEPSDVSMYVVLSALLIEAGRANEAIATLEEALTWQPESPAVLSALGLARLENDEVDLAVASLRKAVELEPENAEHHNRLALALARAGAQEESLRVVRRALELSPDAPHILDSLGTVRWYRDEPEAAIDAYEKAIALSPDQAIYHFNLSLALLKKGDVDRAEIERRKAMRLDPELEPPPDGRPVI